jgi:hypothetical protein
MANSEVMDLMLKIGITENALKTLGDIDNRWPPQTTCADCAFRRSSAAVATSRERHRTPGSDREGQHRQSVQGLWACHNSQSL